MARRLVSLAEARAVKAGSAISTARWLWAKRAASAKEKRPTPA